MKFKWPYIAALVSASVVGVGALSIVSTANAPDPVMDGFCSVPGVLAEEAFYRDRVSFNWLATSGVETAPFAIDVAGYAPASGARFEEMRVDRASLGAVANAAIGRGRVWAMLPPAGTIGSVLDYQDSVPPSALPENSNRDDLLSFDVSEGGTSCELQDWLAGEIERSGGAISNEDHWVAREFREELEVSTPEALATMRANKGAHRCLRPRWTSRSELTLHAYRIYEVRRNGLFNYTLSPLVITDGERVVYFSMSVVRTSPLAVGGRVSDPLERTCCVSPLRTPHCSRFGGPDPYRFDISGRRAFANSRLP